MPAVPVLVLRAWLLGLLFAGLERLGRSAASREDEVLHRVRIREVLPIRREPVGLREVAELLVVRRAVALGAGRPVAADDRARPVVHGLRATARAGAGRRRTCSTCERPRSAPRRTAAAAG